MAITNVTFEGATQVAAAQETWDLSFTPSQNVDSLDSILVTFPDGFDLSQVETGTNITFPGMAGITFGAGWAAGTYAYQVDVNTETNVVTIYLVEGGFGQVLASGTPGPFSIADVVNPTAGTYAKEEASVGTNDEVGVSPADDIVITAGSSAPTVTTGIATGITATGATVPGTVGTNGADVTSIVCRYGTDPTLESGTSTVNASPATLSDPATGEAVTATLSELTSEARYYYAMEATNASGTTRGTIRSFVASVSPRYWVGTSGGDVSDESNWSLSSGGSGGATVPQETNDAVFDANSIGSAGQTVTFDADFTCKDLDLSAVTNAPTFACANDLTVTGDITLAAGVTFSGNFASVTLDRSGTQTLTMAGKTLPIVNVDLTLTGSGTTVLADAFTQPNAQLKLNGGTLNTNGQDFNVRQLSGHATNTITFACAGSLVLIHDAISLLGTGTTITGTTTATLKTASDVDFTIIYLPVGTRWAMVWGTPGTVNTGSAWQIAGGFIADVLRLEGGVTYPFNTGTVSVGAIESLGSAGNLVGITGTFAASAILEADYLDLTDCTVTGGFAAYAGWNSENGGGNSGWTFSGRPGAPVATTTTATSVTTTTATLRATVDPTNAQTTVNFRYGRQADLSDGTVVAAAQSPLAGNAGATAVTAAVTGLLSDLTWYYRPEATNSEGSDNGDIVSFDTAHGDPRGAVTVTRAEVGTAEVTRA